MIAAETAHVLGDARPEAARRWLTEGRRVRIAMPPESDTDMADVLVGRDGDYRRNQDDPA